MGRLTEDMTRLRQEIESGRDSRADKRRVLGLDIEEQRGATQLFLRDVKSRRLVAARRDALARADFISSNATSVSRFLADTAASQAASAREAARTRREFVTRIASETVAHLGGFRRSFEAASARAAQERTDFVNALGSSVAKELDGVRARRKKNADIDALERQRFVNDVGKSVANLLQENAESRAESSAKTAAGLGAFVRDLAGTVSNLLNDYSDDRSGAREGFFGRRAATRHPAVPASTSPSQSVTESIPQPKAAPTVAEDSDESRLQGLEASKSEVMAADVVEEMKEVPADVGKFSLPGSGKGKGKK